MTRRITATRAALLLGLAMAAGACFAQSSKPDEPIEPARPGFANGASVVPQGQLLLEGSYHYTRQSDERKHDSGDERTLRVPTGAYSRGDLEAAKVLHAVW